MFFFFIYKPAEIFFSSLPPSRSSFEYKPFDIHLYPVIRAWLLPNRRLQTYLSYLDLTVSQPLSFFCYFSLKETLSSISIDEPNLPIGIKPPADNKFKFRLYAFGTDVIRLHTVLANDLEMTLK